MIIVGAIAEVIESSAEKDVDALHKIASESFNVSERLDNNIAYVNELLRQYYDGQQRVATDIARGIGYLSCCYEELAQDLLEKAYMPEGKSAGSQAWKSSTYMGKRAIGLLEYVLSRKKEFLLSHDQQEVTKNVLDVLQLGQQVRVVVFTISQMRDTVAGTQDKYDGLLNLQESDLQALGTRALFYGKLTLGCHRLCKRLASSSFGKHIAALGVFLDVLSLLLVSMDQYEKNQCGTAIGMVEEGLEKLRKMGIVSQEYISTVSDRKLRHKAKAKIGHWKQRLKNRNQYDLHPFLQQVLQEFIVPLLVLLQYRYKKSNDSLFMQPVQRGPWDMPQGRLPDSPSVEWNYVDGELRETANTTNYF